MLFVAAGIFAVGVTYFWPTMLGFVAEYTPKTGAVGMSLAGGAGVFAMAIFSPIMGAMYDSNIAEGLPEGADITAYQKAVSGTAEAAQYAAAELTAGPDILETMVFIPIFLIFVFAGLFFYTRNMKQGTLEY
jgi:hypothetical protein